MSRQAIKEKEKYLSKNKAVKIYKKILIGKLKGFPKDYWKTDEQSKENAKMCVCYMAEIILKLKEDEYNKVSRTQLKRYHLEIMLNKVFEGNIYEMINYIHPNKYYEWTFLGRKKDYWSKEKLVWAVNCIIEKNGWNIDDVKKMYSYKMLSDNGLEYAVKKVYNNKIYDLLEDIYKDEPVNIWEFNHVSRGYWTNETAVYSTLWMIRKLGWSRSEIRDKINKNTFVGMGLGGMLKVVYNNSVYDAINAAYPGEYKRYELSVSKGYWTKETAIVAIKDMIEDLKYDKKDVCLKLSKETFKKYKLEYPVQKIFDGSYYEAINATYPGEYSKYDLKNFRVREIKMNKIAEYMGYYEY